jgi:TatD DNase family protein
MAWVPVQDTSALPRLGAGHALVDSHCHLDFDEFDADRDALLRRAADAGVSIMVTIGASGPIERNHAAVALAERTDNVFATVGMHPHEASAVNDDVIQTIAELARGPKVVALGETGLDFHYDHSPRDAQRAALRRFVALARELSLPLVVHLRAADDEAAEILREEHASEVGGVIHCFSSDARAARLFLDLGFHLSFSGILTFKTADAIREAARLAPADRLLVETDAPFLAPIPFRGKRNEPALVVQTAAALADVRGESLDRIADVTRENTLRLFGIPGSSIE